MLVFCHTYSFVQIGFELERVTNGSPIYFWFCYDLKSINLLFIAAVLDNN